MYYTRHPDVALRREHFGGIAFNKSNGDLLELDREACLFLELADGETSLRTLARRVEDELNTKFGISEIHQVTDILREHGFLVRSDSARTSPVDAKTWPRKTQYLSAPESVHVALTHRCNYQCQSCYVDSAADNREMTTAEIKLLIDQMAEMKVFQLAIGGGEPFLRDDLVEIVTYAKLLGIVSNITTNCSLITPGIASELSEEIGQIQLSVNGHNRKLHETARQEGSFDGVLKAMEILQKQNIQFGMNVILCRDNFREIENIIEFGVKQDACTVNFIRSKPSKQDAEWYGKSALSSSEYISVASTLRKVLNQCSSIRINVDCALAFLMSREATDHLQKRGVYGCTGARRFLSIHPDGSAYPCSFLDMPEYYGGNVVRDGLEKIWHESMAFQEFREVPNRIIGRCGSCKSKDFCMGCRAVVLHETGDILSGDNGCFESEF